MALNDLQLYVYIDNCIDDPFEPYEPYEPYTPLYRESRVFSRWRAQRPPRSQEVHTGLKLSDRNTGGGKGFTKLQSRRRLVLDI
jgi:hypothetical protein